MDHGGRIYSVEISKCQVPHSRDFLLLLLKKWFISILLFARENHSDFTKTSGLGEQRRYGSGFTAANNRSQPW